MTIKHCAGCGQPFEPRPQVPNQAYCSLPSCQRARRQRWQHHKMHSDPDYRDNQIRNQRAWMMRHPEYWRNYRGAHPESAKQEKPPQRLQNEPPPNLRLAKMDASPVMLLHPGLYRIDLSPTPGNDSGANWVIKIIPACPDCPCKKDACKDRT